MSDQADLIQARMEAAAEVLRARLASKIALRRVDRAAIAVTVQIVADHRAEARKSGLDFPKLAIMPLPTVGEIKLFNADLDRSSIKVLVVNLAREYPQLSPVDLAMAVKFAFPDFRPDTELH